MSNIRFPAFEWDISISRTAFNIFGKDIYWYGVIIAGGFALAVIYALWKAHKFGLTSDDVIDYLIYGTIPAIICARIYYVIFNFGIYKDDPIKILYIWEGGIAIYGGVIGAFAAIIIIAKLKKHNPFKMLDMVGIGFLIGQMIGRWGNFINAEAYGKAFASQNAAELPFWAMGVYIDGVMTYVHPIFLYESLWNLAGLIFLLIYAKKRKFGGEIMFFYLGWYGLGRFFTEGIRGDDALYLFSSGMRVSQMLGGVLFIATVGIFIWKYTHPSQKGPLYLSPVIAYSKYMSLEERIDLMYPNIWRKKVRAEQKENDDNNVED